VTGCVRQILQDVFSEMRQHGRDTSRIHISIQLAYSEDGLLRPVIREVESIHPNKEYLDDGFVGCGIGQVLPDVFSEMRQHVTRLVESIYL